MCNRYTYSVIEKNKFDNIDEIAKYIDIIVNKLIIKEFVNSMKL